MAEEAPGDYSTADDCSLLLDSIPTVDLRYLSQSELYALSLCSDAAFDPRRCDDVVIPKIDRSVFNESAGSRKQTFSRLRLAPPGSSFASIRRRRAPHLRSPKSSFVETDPERAENSQIVALLKGLFSLEGHGDHDLVPIQVQQINSVPDFGGELKRKRGRPRKDGNLALLPARIEIKDIFIYDNVETAVKKEDNIIPHLSNTSNDNGRKRKRGRPRKDKFEVVTVKNEVKGALVSDNVEDSDKGVLNSNGVAVDVAALAGFEDPFGPEIKRRTTGLVGEAALLGFLEGLRGQWVSRRKKKKIVDACDFGDYLPKDWMICISLKRKEGRIWLFCRRYISPSGRQFISCKEVSSYLLSICDLQEKNQPSSPHGNENIQSACKMASQYPEDVPENPSRESLFSHSSLAITTSISSNHEEQMSEEPKEVQVGETFKCQQDELKCGGPSNNVIVVSANVEPNNEVVTREACDNENVSSTSTEDELRLDSENFATTEPISVSPNYHDVPGKDCPTAVKQTALPHLTGNEQFSIIDNGNYGISSSKLTESEQKIGLESSALAPSGTVGTCIGNNEERVPTCSLDPKFGGAYNCGSNEFGSHAESQTDVAGINEEKQCVNFSVVSPSRERALVIESRQQQVALSSLLSSQNCADNYVDLHPLRRADYSDVKKCRSSNSIASYSGSFNEINANVTDTMKTSLEFCSLLPFGREESYGDQDNVSGAQNSSVEECKQEHSEISVIDRSCFAENPSDMHTVNKIYDRPVNERKLVDTQNTVNNDRSLTFSNPCIGLYADTNVDDENHPANNSAIQSRTEQNIGVQTNLSSVDTNLVEQQRIESLSELFSLSCNRKLWASEKIINTTYTDREWDGLEVDEGRSSVDKKYMDNFDSENQYPGEDVLSGGIWRTDECGGPQNTFADTSNPPEQSPSSFRTFGIISDKVDDGLFRLGEKYERESSSEPSSLGRTDPVEFSFLTTQNSTSLQEDSKNCQHETGMEQQFDSSFWLGKQELMPNMASRSQITTLCVWCRNEFHHEPVLSGTQAAVGSLCPTCRTRISDQVNIL